MTPQEFIAALDDPEKKKMILDKLALHMEPPDITSAPTEGSSGFGGADGLMDKALSVGTGTGRPISPTPTDLSQYPPELLQAFGVNTGGPGPTLQNAANLQMGAGATPSLGAAMMPGNIAQIMKMMGPGAVPPAPRLPTGPVGAKPIAQPPMMPMVPTRKRLPDLGSILTGQFPATAGG